MRPITSFTNFSDVQYKLLIQLIVFAAISAMFLLLLTLIKLSKIKINKGVIKMKLTYIEWPRFKDEISAFTTTRVGGVSDTHLKV